MTNPQTIAGRETGFASVAGARPATDYPMRSEEYFRKRSEELEQRKLQDPVLAPELEAEANKLDTLRRTYWTEAGKILVRVRGQYRVEGKLWKTFLERVKIKPRKAEM